MSQYYPGKYPANFNRIPDSAGCLHLTGYRIVLSGSGTSLAAVLVVEVKSEPRYYKEMDSRATHAS